MNGAYDRQAAIPVLLPGHGPGANALRARRMR
jgi:hypothetical protein